MRLISPAKLNLFLRVTGHDDFGYHKIESLMVFVDLADEITITPTSDALSVRFEMDPRLKISLPPILNSVSKVVSLYERAIGTNIALDISVKKRVPSGAGLGGGSMNAAVVLQALEDLYGALELDARKEILLNIGCDAVVCSEHVRKSHGGFFVSGIGENARAVDVSELLSTVFLLIYPQIESPTKNVYREFRRTGSFDVPEPLPELLTVDWLVKQRNSLEKASCSLEKKVQELQKFLEGDISEAEFFRMSGSGSSFFVACRDVSSAEQVCRCISKRFPEYLTHLGRIKA